MRRVLKNNGILAFLVKSVNDPLYGKGERLEKNMYELEGHIRHFFSTDYTKDILNEEFDINLINEGKDEFYGKKSSFIKVLARKKSLSK